MAGRYSRGDLVTITKSFQESKPDWHSPYKYQIGEVAEIYEVVDWSTSKDIYRVVASSSGGPSQCPPYGIRIKGVGYWAWEEQLELAFTI